MIPENNTPNEEKGGSVNDAIFLTSPQIFLV
jgi:hypothetical protein